MFTRAIVEGMTMVDDRCCPLFNGEMGVESMAELFTQSPISHRLRFLKASRLVKVRKEGKYVFYSPDDVHVTEIYKMGLEHLEEK